MIEISFFFLKSLIFMDWLEFLEYLWRVGCRISELLLMSRRRLKSSKRMRECRFDHSFALQQFPFAIQTQIFFACHEAPQKLFVHCPHVRASI